MAVSEDNRRDLILGVVNNYTYYEITPFLLTLRKTSFAGHLCLFAGPGISASTVALMKSSGAEVVRYEESFPFVDDPHPDNVKALPDPIHIYNYRHFLYLDYLLKHPGEFRNVLITDVRDVVFQRDPFDFDVEGSIHVAMESVDLPIGACPWTSGWVVSGFGEEALEAVRDAEMSCAGTTLGPVAEMERYERALLGMIRQMHDAYDCADQAAHNRLLHQGALAPAMKMYNFRGPILTMGTEAAYRVNGQGELINDDGSVINVVHQYDRHPELVRQFERRIWPAAWRRLAAKAMHRVQYHANRLLRSRRATAPR